MKILDTKDSVEKKLKTNLINYRRIKMAYYSK